MSRLLRSALTITSAVVPLPHRQRWQEESLAVLLAVRGPRRWRYALDTIMKAPLLAGQCRRAAPDTGPAPWVGVVAAVGLLCIPVMLLVSFVGGPLLDPGGAEFLLGVAACGMLPTVAVHCWRSARRRGGGLVWCTFALLVAVFAGTGPIAAGALSSATDAPAIAVVLSLLPGGWLMVACGYALHERRGPAALAVLGGIAGTALTGVLVSMRLSMDALGPVQGPALTVIFLLSALVLVPTYLAWSTWTAIRFLIGQRDLLAG